MHNKKALRWQSIRWWQVSLLLSCWLMICASSMADGGVRSLDIVLTNDDGYDAPGIEAVKAALQAAGHRVTIIAPLENQSASSMRITIGPLHYAQKAPDVWAVDGSPADSVAVGLRVIRKGAPPDLVVSGANFGHNVGRTANVSGTVSAALMAEYLGVPAIALSVGMNLAEKAAKPEPFPSTIAAFPRAAEYFAALIGTLASTAGDDPILSPATVLNVNYPVTPGAVPRGTRVTRSADVSAFSFDYVDTGKPDEVKLAFTAETAADAHPDDADTALFAEGYVTISVLDGDLGASAAAVATIASRMRAVTE